MLLFPFILKFCGNRYILLLKFIFYIPHNESSLELNARLSAMTCQLNFLKMSLHRAWEL